MSGRGSFFSTEASDARREGKVWDVEKRSWSFYILDDDLTDLEERVRRGSEDGGRGAKTNFASGGGGEEREVADREYYDLLGISTGAESSAVKKAYYAKARQCHPDKNPDDPSASEKFQALGHAYQILSNEQTRAAYDKSGKGGIESAEMMSKEVDPFVFFNVMFGSHLVEPYIGELWIADTADAMMKEAPDIDANLSDAERSALIGSRMSLLREKDALKQRLRQTRCARNLRDRIRPFVEDVQDAETFAVSCREEATKISEGAYGELYCQSVGFALLVGAEEYLGRERTFLGLGGKAAAFRRNFTGFRTNFQVVGAGIKAIGAGSRAMQESEKQSQESGASASDSVSKNPQEMQAEKAAKMMESLNETLPAFLELTWAINKGDIQSTLMNVCKKLFDDCVPRQVRLKRAEAVRILGREFQFVSKLAKKAGPSKNNFEAEDIKARVHVAAMATMAKAQGQDMTEQDQEEMIKQAKQMSMEMKNMSHGVDDGVKSGSEDVPVAEEKGQYRTDWEGDQKRTDEGAHLFYT